MEWVMVKVGDLQSGIFAWGVPELGILPNTVALAAVALLGYLFGRSRLRTATPDPNQMRRELKRAKSVAAELERIAQQVRRNLASHHSSVLQFKDRLAELGVDPEQVVARDICQEAEQLLRPTLKLVASMANAYDELRQQSNMLMSFTEVRTDALTGLSNRRAMDEAMATFLAIQKRYRSPFSLAIFDIDHFKQVNDEHGHLHGDAVLKQVAGVLESHVRETDIVARYGGEEFVIVMPETDLAGAVLLTRRIRRAVEQQTTVTVSSGVAEAIDGESSSTLLARADEALYAAKAAGRNCIYLEQDGSVEAIPPLSSPSEYEESLHETADGRAAGSRGLCATAR